MEWKQMGISAAMLILVGIITAAPLVAQGFGKTNAPGRYSEEFGGSIEAVLSDIETGILTEAEKKGILLMREEEKLARDVYLTLSEKWNIPVFANIARSEATHMEAMEVLIARYGLDDPVTDEDSSNRGSYSHAEFETMYTELVNRGMSSYEEAFKVGAFIEDLDIADLQSLISKSGNEDVKIVYQNLLKGSRNHLRSFDRQLQRSDVTYSPEHISQTEYRNIASTPREAGVIVSER